MRFEQAKDLLDAFSREGVQYVLVGSTAMAAHGIVRATEDIEAETIDIDGTPVMVATPSMLYAMKRDTTRPQDQADADVLRERFDLEG